MAPPSRGEILYEGSFPVPPEMASVTLERVGDLLALIDGRVATEGGANGVGAILYRQDGDAWVEHSRLPLPQILHTPSSYARTFGLASDGDHLVFGTQVYRRDGEYWSLLGNLQPPVPIDPNFSFYGGRVAVSGDTLVIGSRSEPSAEAESPGAVVYVSDVFERDGGTWHHVASLPKTGSLSISGDFISIGEFLYRRTADGNWVETEALHQARERYPSSVYTASGENLLIYTDFVTSDGYVSNTLPIATSVIWSFADGSWETLGSLRGNWVVSHAISSDGSRLLVGESAFYGDLTLYRLDTEDGVVHRVGHMMAPAPGSWRFSTGGRAMREVRFQTGGSFFGASVALIGDHMFALEPGASPSPVVHWYSGAEDENRSVKVGVGQEWVYDYALGSYQEAAHPWIYHEDLGWVYKGEDDFLYVESTQRWYWVDGTGSLVDVETNEVQDMTGFWFESENAGWFYGVGFKPGERDFYIYGQEKESWYYRSLGSNSTSGYSPNRTIDVISGDLVDDIPTLPSRSSSHFERYPIQTLPSE